MKHFLEKTLLNDHVILVVILINSVDIFLIESGVSHPALFWIDMFCMLIFLLEMIAKLAIYGQKQYWHDGWNCMDGVLVILSLPSFVLPFLDVSSFNFSAVLTLRLLRVLRFLRVFHFFPDIVQIGAGLRRALRDTSVILIGGLVFLVLFGLINCSIYRDLAPDYFSTPLQSIYSVFRIFTTEGWYEIPDAIAATTSPAIAHLTRLYFCVLLALFGILGMSFINSVFVDAMVEDNNDDVKEQLHRMEQQQHRLEQQIQELHKMLEKNSKQ